METLIKSLKSQTETLKNQYLEKTKEWAQLRYAEQIEKVKWTEEQWCVWLGIEPKIIDGTDLRYRMYKDGDKTFPENFYNTKNARIYRRALEAARSVSRKTENEYLDSEEERAVRYYENSIEKLADRIIRKNLDIEKIELKTSHIDVNIETTITDGNKTVKAWTIIASGMVQRPHYRYLIK